MQDNTSSPSPPLFLLLMLACFHLLQPSSTSILLTTHPDLARDAGQLSRGGQRRCFAARNYRRGIFIGRSMVGPGGPRFSRILVDDIKVAFLEWEVAKSD